MNSVLFIMALMVSLAMDVANAQVFDFGVGTRVTRFEYAEELSPPQKSTENATFPSLMFLGKYNPTPFFHVTGIYETAPHLSSRYVGSDLNTGAPVVATNTLSFTTTEFALHYDISPDWSVYAGYGWKTWSRFLAGFPGYRELYRWNYAPVGAQYWVMRTGQVDVGLDFSLRPTSHASIKVITSENYPHGQDTLMALGSRTGYRMAVPMLWNLGHVIVSATPYFELSQLGASRVATNSTLAPGPGSGIMEPNSHTHQYGAEVLLIFSVL